MRRRRKFLGFISAKVVHFAPQAKKMGFPRFEGFPKRGVSKKKRGIQNLSGAGFETVEKTGVSKIFIRGGLPKSGAAFENSRGIQNLIGGHPKKKRGIQEKRGASKSIRGGLPR